jgi:hypothetical protein
MTAKPDAYQWFTFVGCVVLNMAFVKSKAAKFVMVCILCIAVAVGAALIIQAL